MRKLATIQRIKEIRPIPDADAIEVARVNNWDIVVKKGEYKAGDYCVYCEIDSFLPIHPNYEFLRKSSYKKMGDKEGFRLKTIRLRGQLSQGLILPTAVLASTNYAYFDIPGEGHDVTPYLGIDKYEPPIPACLAGKIKGFFPGFLVRTDEERIQNLSDEYEVLKQLTYYVSEKIDGSSGSYYIKDGEFGVCSRNLDLLESEGNTFWQIARREMLEEKLVVYGRNLAIQGEVIGEGIQDNKYKLKGHAFRVFNVFDIDERRRFSLDQMLQFCSDLGLTSVPILERIFTLPEAIDELLIYAEGKSVLNDTTEREGVVIRTLDMTTSFKAISNRFLLKLKE